MNVVISVDFVQAASN